MKIVLDSNIYIAAFISKGLTAKILDKAMEGALDIYTSNEILNEVSTRLKNKLKLDEDYIDEYIEHIKNAVTVVDPEEKLRVVTGDPTDNKIIDCAVESEAHLIISMDKHLLKLKTYENIGIIHPKTLTWIIPKLTQT